MLPSYSSLGHQALRSRASVHWSAHAVYSIPLLRVAVGTRRGAVPVVMVLILLLLLALVAVGLGLLLLAVLPKTLPVAVAVVRVVGVVARLRPIQRALMLRLLRALT